MHGVNSIFKNVDKEQISITIKWLDSKKVWKSNDIPLRIIKTFRDIFGGFLAKNFIECLDKGFFSRWTTMCRSCSSEWKKDK